MMQKSQVLHQNGNGGNLRLSVMQKSDAHLALFWWAKSMFQPSTPWCKSF